MRNLFDAPAISVGELCRRIRGALRGRFPTSVRVFGETSQSRTVSGNTYFKLKDREGLIDCCCFAGSAARLRVALPLPEGTAVEVEGFVDIYEKNSAYQLRVTDIVPLGTGALYLAREQLRAKLAAEGLFDRSRKRPIPAFISAVAVVTSRNAAALADFVSTCRRRGAHVRIWLQHAPVQGAAAAPGLAKAIARAGTLPVDVVVVARGGGSLEDLWAFNTEQVARAIAGCAKPVISAIGHETDQTIADLVADLRVATPTAAAEFVAQEREALLERIAVAQSRMRKALARWVAGPRASLQRAQRDLRRAMVSSLSARAQRVDDLATRVQRGDPRKRIMLWRARAREATVRLRILGGRVALSRAAATTSVTGRLAAAFANASARRGQHVAVAEARLLTLGPRETLRRGYAIACDARGGLLTDSAKVRVGERIGIELKSGWLGAHVDEKKERHGEDRLAKD